MDENKNRVWNALRIYYGIADSLEFSDENCTQTVYNNTLYIYSVIYIPLFRRIIKYIKSENALLKKYSDGNEL